MRKQIRLLVGVGGLVLSALFLSFGANAEGCAGNDGTCTQTWWCCNCHGQSGCREEIIQFDGYRPI